MDIEVWCLLINHDYNGNGLPFPVVMQDDEMISALAWKVCHLLSLNVSYIRLDVWRCESPFYFDAKNKYLVSEVWDRVEDLFKGYREEVHILDVDLQIKTLNLLRREVLFIQMPEGGDHSGEIWTQGFWERTWNYKGAGVPLCKIWHIERGNTLADDSVKVPESCWIMSEDTHPTVTVLGLPSGQALIRADYIEALRELFVVAGLETLNFNWQDAIKNFTNPFLQAKPGGVGKEGAFILTGHPGIGKSIWLRLLLVLRLHAKLLTFFFPNSQQMYYFDGEGWLMIRDRDRGSYFREYFSEDRNAWVLVDSKELGNVPTYIHETCTFIVQAAPPRNYCLSWENKYNFSSYTFLMKPWSLSELLTGRKLQERPRTECELAAFFQNYGPSARKAYLESADRQEALVDALCKEPPINELRSLLASTFLFETGHGLTHDLIVLYPGEDRRWPDVTIASQRVYDKLLAYHTEEAAFELFRYFNTSEEARDAANFVLQRIMHPVLRKGGRWPIALEKPAKGGSRIEHWKVLEPGSEETNKRRFYLFIDAGGIHIEEDQSQVLQGNFPLHDIEFGPIMAELGPVSYRPTADSPWKYDLNFFIYDKIKKHAFIFRTPIDPAYGRRALELEDEFDANVEKKLRDYSVEEVTRILLTPKVQRLIFGPQTSSQD